MGIEYELKFRATGKVLAVIATEYSQYPSKQFHMETTYYDTPSGALSQLHYTLRRRMENDKSVCTLKTPATGLGRNEIELECGNIEDSIPALCAAGAPENFGTLVQEGILPVCSAKFHRTAITLTLENCTLELALDSGTLTGGNKTIPLCEVEVELKKGEPASADLFAKMLAIQYGLLPETHSKFRRALSLYKGEKL